MTPETELHEPDRDRTLITLESYEEDRVLLYDEKGNELTVPKQSDEERFAQIVKMLDFSASSTASTEHHTTTATATTTSTNSTSIASSSSSRAEQQSLPMPSLVDMPRSFHWTKTVQKLRDGLFELDQLARFLSELREGHLLEIMDIPQEASGTTLQEELALGDVKAVSKEKLATLGALYGEKRKQLRVAAGLLQRGRDVLQKRILHDHDYFTQLYCLQQQQDHQRQMHNSASWCIVEPHHKTSTAASDAAGQLQTRHSVIIDIAFRNSYMPLLYQYIPASVVRRTTVKSKKGRNNGGSRDKALLDIILPSICTYGKQLVSINDHLQKQGHDVLSMNKDEHLQHVHDILSRAQQSAFNMDLFDAFSKSIMYISQCIDFKNSFTLASMTSSDSAASLGMLRAADMHLADACGSFLHLDHFTRHSIKLLITHDHFISVSLRPCNTNTFWELNVEQNCLGSESENKGQIMCKYIELLLREMLMDVHEFIRRNPAFGARYATRNTSASTRATTSQTDAFLSSANTTLGIGSTLWGAVQRQIGSEIPISGGSKIMNTGVAISALKPQVPQLGHGPVMDTVVNDYTCRKVLDIILFIRHRLFMDKHLCKELQHLSNDLLIPQYSTAMDIVVSDHEYPNRSSIELIFSHCPSSSSSNGYAHGDTVAAPFSNNRIHLDVVDTAITTQLHCDVVHPITDEAAPKQQLRKLQMRYISRSKTMEITLEEFVEYLATAFANTRQDFQNSSSL